MANRTDNQKTLQTPIDWVGLVDLTSDANVAHKVLAILIKETEELIPIISKLIDSQDQNQTFMLQDYIHKLAGAARHSMATQLTNLLFDMEKHIRMANEENKTINWQKMDKSLDCVKKEINRIIKFNATQHSL